MNTTATDKSAEMKAITNASFDVFDRVNDLCREVRLLQERADKLSDETGDDELENKLNHWGTQLYIAELSLRSVWEIFDNFIPY